MKKKTNPPPSCSSLAVFIAREGDTVEDICNKLHRRMKREFRYGLVWGKSVKFGGQRVGLSHILQDEDVLTIIKTRGA